MDLLAGLRIAIDAFWYNILLALAGLHWSLLRGFIMMGYTVEVINTWLIEQAFAPLISMANDSLQVAVSIAFVVALFLLGITYLLASVVRLEVVSPRSAILWYIAGALFFTMGPTLYSGMNDLRMSVASAFYLSALDSLQDTSDSAFESFSQVNTTDLGLGTLCDQLGVYLPNATSAGRIDGIDVALAYLRADGPDIMGYPQPMYSPGCTYHPIHPATGVYVAEVPMEWFFEGSYFDILNSPYYFDEKTDEERAASIGVASSAHGRLLTAWPLVLFGVMEQIVYLLITIAQGVTFISFALAILFAFFKRTESIAHSVVNQWIELIVQTIAIALIQSLVVALFLAGTTSGNSMVVLGIGLICLVFMVITLWSGIKAVWNSFNRLFNAIGQATGGVMVTPARAAMATVGGGASALGTASSVGSNALAGMSAVNMGATRAQAAGVALGGVQTLTSAARTLAYLPGVRTTMLGEAAEQFAEGATTRQVARNVPMVGSVAGPFVGARLLSNRDEDAANYDAEGRLLSRPMLVPAIGDAVEGWTIPKNASRARRNLNPPDGQFEDIDGDGIGDMVTPSRPRMGMFTPQENPRRERERSEYVSDMQGEELEKHITEQLQANRSTSTTGGVDRLDQAASKLERAAAQFGQLKVSGAEDVASVIGDVLRLTQSKGENSIDHFTLSQRMAQVMGLSSSDAGKAQVQQDLTRFGLFSDLALRLGLSGTQAQNIVHEVQTSPSRALSDSSRESIVNMLVTQQNYSQTDAQHQAVQLEQYARSLPTQITAQGSMKITPQNDTKMDGSKEVL